MSEDSKQKMRCRKTKQTKNVQRKASKTSKEITSVTAAFTALFLVMMGYFACYALTHEEELLNNSYNSRQQLLAAQNRRGTIYAAGGEVLAETIERKDQTEQRVYPYGNLFAHAVGYAEKGRTGVEAQMNYSLIHSSLPSAEKVRKEQLGEKIPADHVYTTLDVRLQEAASKALGVYKGAVIAMDPRTGAILAMVSKPDFDPNEIASVWDEIVGDSESGRLLNRASQGLYPPGSTFKIITALEYIRENPDSYEKYAFTCTGRLQEDDSVINCYHGSKHGAVDLKRSFSKSCNASFANIGLQLDKEKFSETLEDLLFQQELLLPCAYKQSRLTITEESTAADMMQAAIGQGKIQMTPMHLAMITAAAANHGTLMKPYLAEKVVRADGAEVKKTKPEKYKELMSVQEAAVLTEYMQEVVEHGTAAKLSGLPYTAAGKTGSAEFSSRKEESHAWFTGFAPAEDPQLVVTVIIEGAGSGGDYAVPMARRVFDAFLNE